MKFCSSADNRRVAYETKGHAGGTPLVLVHGFCEDHSVWAPIQPMLSSSNLLLMDMPGFGQSEPPAKEDMEAYAAAILAVLDAEQIQRCVLVGHSMGGYAALEFAARWPERLAGLGLVHSHPFEDSEERKAARLRGIETLRAGKRDLYVAQLFPNLFAPAFAQEHAGTVNELISNGKKQSAEAIAAALQAMLTRRDHRQTLVEATYPVLFLLGAQDALVPPDLGLKAAMLPQIADVHLLPAVAHMVMFECPTEGASILNAFWGLCHQGALGGK